ncbi:hypothetical protein QU38_01395, partial [Staphylococcus aureus]
MGDEAHVGLVDPHAEGDRGDDHHLLRGDERRLVAAADFAVQPGMIGQHRPAGLGGKLLGQLLHPGAGLGIDDAGARRLCDQVDHLPRRVLARGDRVADIGPGEAGDGQPFLRQPPLLGGGGGGV